MITRQGVGVRQYQEVVRLDPRGRGLHDITEEVSAVVDRADLRVGVCLVFVQHTSASLLIQENADPSARRDLEDYFERLAPEGDPHYTHTAEGTDDMPAHLRAALTHTSEQIPVVDGRLGLGTWQGLYLFEHRRRASGRRVVVHVWGE
jgi:secondary thiamine-phosphate synthase enzyme